MSIFSDLSTLALSDVVGDAAGSIGANIAADAAGAAVGLLYNHFKDHSDRLGKALSQSTDRAWKTLELALAGESFWERCKGFVASGDQTKFRNDMRRYLNDLALPPGAEPEKFRRTCLAELKAARKEGLFDGAALDPKALADEVGAFAKYGDAAGVMDAERRVMARISAALKVKHYDNLSDLLARQPRPGDSLVTIAARYFFRRAVEDDPKLFQGLAFIQLGQIQQTQTEGLATLQTMLGSQGEQLDTMLADLSADVFATFNAVLDVQEEQKRQSGKHDDVYKAVIQLQQRLDLMHTELRPRDSLSIRGDVERRLAREVVSKYRAMPEERRKELPALLNAVGKLEVAAGDFHAAERDFAAVAQIVDDSAAKAEAHANAHRTALERRDWDAALRELLTAAKLDPKRYEPFPLRKYRPLRILGAGGFGIAYLCRHERLATDVVVKTLAAGDLDRGIADVFAEARVLRQMDHPAIIGLRDCDYADDALTRPYLEMDFFESQTLEQFVLTNGPLSERDLTDVARRVAEGLRAAHARGVLHRDVKPANILVRKSEDRFDVKLIDFGLAMAADRLLGSATSATLRGSTIAGTIDYAAPEQMGRLPGVPLSFASDVFGFARTCYFALFRTPHPKAKHFDGLSPGLKRLLDDCTSDDPKERPATFDAVLAALGGATTVAPVLATPKAQATGPRADEPPEQPWLATDREFAEATRQFWLAGKAGAFAPRHQVVARQQPRDEFLSDVLHHTRFITDNGFPFFKDEVWIAGNVPQTMRLTTYRLILTMPDSEVRTIPLKEISKYSFAGTGGTLRGSLFGNAVRLTGSFGDFQWKGPQLEGLHFPLDALVLPLLRLGAWKSLPAEALHNLGFRQTEFVLGPWEAEAIPEAVKDARADSPNRRTVFASRKPAEPTPEPTSEGIEIVAESVSDAVPEAVPTPPAAAATFNRVTCACGKVFKVKSELAGRRAKCYSCGRMFRVPAEPLDVLPAVEEVLPADPAVPPTP